MKSYQNFIGIDIGKFEFYVNCYGGRAVECFENNQEGIVAFISQYKRQLSEGLVVLETTGGYEMALLMSLLGSRYSVHRANTRQVKNFIRSLGHGAKTDRLDARYLAQYGHERHARLNCFQAFNEAQIALYQAVQRRADLKRMLVAEKNREQGPSVSSWVKESCQQMRIHLEQEIERLQAYIKTIIAKDGTLAAHQKILQTIPGIGEVVSQSLLALLPELGQLTRREVASLVGVAPRANESGIKRGYRRTMPGRQGIKPMLFMAAMAARNANDPLKAHYLQLVGRGKKKMVALTALMRKIIVIANARIRDYENSRDQERQLLTIG